MSPRASGKRCRKAGVNGAAGVGWGEDLSTPPHRRFQQGFYYKVNPSRFHWHLWRYKSSVKKRIFILFYFIFWADKEPKHRMLHPNTPTEVDETFYNLKRDVYITISPIYKCQQGGANAPQVFLRRSWYQIMFRGCSQMTQAFTVLRHRTPLPSLIQNHSTSFALLPALLVGISVSPCPLHALSLSCLADTHFFSITSFVIPLWYLNSD